MFSMLGQLTNLLTDTLRYSHPSCWGRCQTFCCSTYTSLLDAGQPWL